MSTPIEALAQEYVEQAWFDLEYSSFGTTAKECQKAFMAGAKAASGLQEAELEHTRKNRDTAIEYNNQLAENSLNQINELSLKLSKAIAQVAEEIKIWCPKDDRERYMDAFKAELESLSGAGKGEGHG